MDALKLETFAAAKYQKCECCDRVKDNFFQLRVYDAKTKQLLVGSFSLCKTCGENLGGILQMNTKTEMVMAEFEFDGDI